MNGKSMFEIMQRTLSFLEEDWSNFCNSFFKIAETIRNMNSEGEALSVVVDTLTMGGVPAPILERMTNSNLASLCDGVGDIFVANGKDKNYLFGMINERGSLDLYIFNPTNGAVNSVSAPIPDFSMEFAGQLMRSIWIKKNIEKYVFENNCVDITIITNFMCNLNN